MIHFLYLIGFGFFVSTAFALYTKGSVETKVKYGFKSFGQFIIISLVLAWVFYFIPW